MILARRLMIPLSALVLAWSAAGAVTHTIDGSLPEGGDCPLFGDWDANTHTCRIENARIEDGDWLRIESATLEVAGTLTNEGVLDNRSTIVVTGFLNSLNDLVNFWDGTMVNRGRFFSHFMYNFGGLTNEATGTVEFAWFLENNAPLVNHGHIDIGGVVNNITDRTIENFGSLAISVTGSLTNGGRLVHAGSIDNAGVLANDAEFFQHCEAVYAGNPVEGQAPSPAQALYAGRALLEWCAIEGLQGYDVVAGDLGLLRSSGGDFSVATTRCPGNDLTGLSLEVASEPEAGQGMWFLVRANGVVSAGFDIVFSSQVGSRGDEIAASAGACR